MSPPISAFLPGGDEQRIERYRQMSITEKLEAIGAVNRLEGERQRADIRARYGEVSEEEMRIHLGVRRLGAAMVEKVVGQAELVRVLGRRSLPSPDPGVQRRN